ncbi:MAG: hypothetical protein Q9214_001393 [Letrouitia sp. 1 TL-2023]
MRPRDSTPPSASRDVEDINTIDSQYRSTPPPASVDLTPPPSSQIPKPPAKVVHMSTRREHSLASPPPTLRTVPPISSGRLFGEVPSIESVQEMNDDQLRNLVTEMLPALSEARMSAAHAKLQHNLLSIETAESAKRAEVEHEMTRREVQVLQEASPVSRGGNGHSLSPSSPQASTQRHLDLALKHCRELQNENSLLERRLHQAKKFIRDLSGKNEDLIEINQLLRQRIKDNRDHLDSMRSSGAISVNGTPLTDFGTPLHRITPRTPGTTRSMHAVHSHVRSQDPFDALLIAGEVLSNEANSVPATPTRVKARKVQSMHMRGAHSLSSLPTTPNRSRPITADNAILTPAHHNPTHPRASVSAPGTQLIRNEAPRRYEDRDSTISPSEDEGDSYVDYVPASQASQRATNMLRRSATASNDNTPGSSQKAVDPSRDMNQAKIYGHVRKSGPLHREKYEKRGGDVNSYDELSRSAKKARMGERVGLGIESYPSPGR